MQPLEISQGKWEKDHHLLRWVIKSGVPENSSSLKNGSMTKVVTMYCGPFTIIKSIGDVITN